MVFMQRKFLWEADDNDTSEDNGAGNDNTEDSAGNADTDNNGEEPAEDSTDNDNTGDDDENIDGDQNDEGDDNNFDIDSEEDENSDEGGDDEGSDDTGTDDSGGDMDDSSADTDSEDKQIDRDMFETLSDAEKKQKIQTLKKLFLELYNRCDNIIDHYDSAIDKYENITPIARRVILILYDLKKYIADYTTGLFDSKSYIENDVMYNRCLSVLNGVKMVTKDVVKMVENND